jgi:L-asparagine transporter-like permease
MMAGVVETAEIVEINGIDGWLIIVRYRQALGEMATAIPVTGSFTEYAQRFVDDSLAFGLGWAYWYLWVTVRLFRFLHYISIDHTTTKSSGC